MENDETKSSPVVILIYILFLNDYVDIINVW